MVPGGPPTGNATFNGLDMATTAPPEQGPGELPARAATDPFPAEQVEEAWRDAAVNMPVTIPRLATNQREATVAANTVAMQPDPRPTTTPHNAIRCHGVVICVVPSAPSEMVSSAVATTRRRP
jgi:hypothetical protein